MEYPKEIDNLLCPQLDYVVKCWDALYDCGLEMAEQFRERFNYGNVDGLDTLHDYENDWMIEEILSTYDIDPEKLWYLVLMASDYSNGMGAPLVFKEAPQYQLDKLFSLIQSNLRKHITGYTFDTDPEMQLTLSVKEKGRKKRTNVTVDTANALAFLSYLYESADKTGYSKFLNTAIADSFTVDTLPQTQKLACFTKLMSAVLDQFKAKHGLGSRDVPKNKKYLVSRLAYIVGLIPTKDSRFIDQTRPNYLVDFIKDYEGINIMGINNHYSFDFLSE